MVLNQNMNLTKDDFKALSDLIDERIDEKAETVLVTKNEISHLPTKEEFFDREDKLMGELKSIREEIDLLPDLNRKVNDDEIRLEVVEKKIGVHAQI